MGQLKEVPCFLCKGKKKPDPKCDVCKGKGTIKFKFAPDTELGYLSLFKDRILDALEEVSGIRPFFISDMSSLGDFEEVGQKERAEMSELLGVSVKKDDLLIDIAKRMKNV